MAEHYAGVVAKAVATQASKKAGKKIGGKVGEVVGKHVGRYVGVGEKAGGHVGEFVGKHVGQHVGQFAGKKLIKRVGKMKTTTAKCDYEEQIANHGCHYQQSGVTITTVSMLPPYQQQPFVNNQPYDYVNHSYNGFVLPEGWEMRCDPNGRKYYVNHSTQTTTWELPSTALPAGWEMRRDVLGRVYYANHETKTTAWELDRREDMHHVPLPEGWETQEEEEYYTSMPEDMQQDAIDCVSQALEMYNFEKDIAAYIKNEFDKKYNPTWHCIVGRDLESYVMHETDYFIYFSLDQIAILLFKSG